MEGFYVCSPCNLNHRLRHPKFACEVCSGTKYQRRLAGNPVVWGAYHLDERDGSL